MRYILSLTTAIALLFSVLPVPAFETDQYNLPPEPLADIGDEVTEYVAGKVRLAAAMMNAEIAAAESCLEAKTEACDRTDSSKRLEYLRSEAAVAKAVYDILSGGNLMTTKFGKWMYDHKFREEPSSYKAPYLESIYTIKPSNYVTLSPTVRMYGQEFGIDKLEHLFQQGHQYYERVNDSIKSGRTFEDSVRKAIEWGKRTERTYYGILTSGVYSNADLFANYVGLKFYQGLTRPLTIGDVARPAILTLKDGRWHMADENTLREHLLRPFISDHMNEAFNPSAFRFTLVGSVSRSVKKNSCQEWRSAYPALTRSTLRDRAKLLEAWNGEDYGHTKRRGSVNIGEICFGADVTSGKRS